MISTVIFDWDAVFPAGCERCDGAGFVRVLARLHDRRIKTGICSIRTDAESRLTAGGIRVGMIVDGILLPRPRLEVGHWLLCAELLGAEAANCVAVVGTAEGDVTARQAGMRTVTIGFAAGSGDWMRVASLDDLTPDGLMAAER